MGMYDYLKVSIDKLPITNEEKELHGDNLNFQTKEFECTLNTYFITDDGLLQYRHFNQDYLDTTDELFANIGVPDETNGTLVTIPYHGVFRFYDFFGEHFTEFNAKFTDGKLVEIIRIK